MAMEFFCLFQAGAASGAAAKRSKSGDDVEIDMREEAQKGRVSDLNQRLRFVLCLYSNNKAPKGGPGSPVTPSLSPPPPFVTHFF